MSSTLSYFAFFQWIPNIGNIGQRKHTCQQTWFVATPKIHSLLLFYDSAIPRHRKISNLDCGIDSIVFMAGPRALSDAQEKAQLLTGTALPESILKSLLSGSTVGEKVFLLNLSPYEACFEKTALLFPQKCPGYSAKTLSVSTDVQTSQYCERMVAMFLMEDF